MKDFNARELITRGKKGYTFDEVAVLYNLSPEALKAKMDKAFLSSVLSDIFFKETFLEKVLPLA